MTEAGKGSAKLRLVKTGGKRGRAKQPSIAVRKACFLEILRQTANVARAAREAGLSSSTVYSHRARFPGFARDWDAAVAEALDELESQLMERARNGVEKPVYYRGEVVGSVRTYSDSLGMFLLKAKRPEVYDRMGGNAPPSPPTISEAEAKAEVLRRIALLRGPDADDVTIDMEDDGDAA
ncbi:hypothetical protein [Stakelama tenebrarum]|uniref:Terminase n=1 Tax=Stakelama tenebrarum TaxID=2711215 RepID=A0A6G6Y9U1_9SPHN|nr:hypothetical protein [Sphingosinithalassobacter tenebrarum]QIG81577.1 hypothetical protein G5C33_18485 [Sphingosinithalassobacter tenebrarum]